MEYIDGDSIITDTSTGKRVYAVQHDIIDADFVEISDSTEKKSDSKNKLSLFELIHLYLSYLIIKVLIVTSITILSAGFWAWVIVQLSKYFDRVL